MESTTARAWTASALARLYWSRSRYDNPEDCHEHEPGNAEQDRIPPFARSM